MEVRRRHTNKGHYNDDEDESRPLLDDHDEKKAINIQTEIVSQNAFYESVWQIVSYFWQSLYDTIWSSTPVLDEESKQSLLELKKMALETFDKENEAHMQSLYKLWQVGFGDDAPVYNLVSQDWKKLGFQSDDPMRDFRGVGIFGLEQILFFAEKCPAKFRHILDIEHYRGSEMYPFVVASFNVTMMIFELLGWGWKTKGISTALNQGVYMSMVKILLPTGIIELEMKKDTLNLMYCIAMIQLDNKWDDMKATYMDFPNVLKATQADFEKLFCYDKVSLLDLERKLENLSRHY